MCAALNCIAAENFDPLNPITTPSHLYITIANTRQKKAHTASHNKHRDLWLSRTLPSQFQFRHIFHARSCQPQGKDESTNINKVGYKQFTKTSQQNTVLTASLSGIKTLILYYLAIDFKQSSRHTQTLNYLFNSRKQNLIPNIIFFLALSEFPDSCC
jgi:hypothetical protein